MNLTQAIKIHNRLAAIADDLQGRVCRLRQTLPLGQRGMPGFDTVPQVTDACLELDRQIDNLRERLLPGLSKSNLRQSFTALWTSTTSTERSSV